MQKGLFRCILLIVMLTACASPAQTKPPSIPNANMEPASGPSDLTPAQRAAIAGLSRILDLPADEITLLSTESVIWPDDCLGVPRADALCNQAPVEGFRIVLEANGKQYEYHANLDGSVVVLAEGEPTPGPVEEIVINQLATNLGLDKHDIAVVSNSDVQFEDSCMGVPMKDVKCAQVAISGKIIFLEAQGVRYEYRVRSNGLILQPATRALIWSRDGGVAGFCDSISIFLSGEIYGNRCNADPDRITGTFADLLSQDEIAQLMAWIREFGQVDLDASEPEGVSDRTEITVQFYGTGQGVPGDSDEQALLVWIQNLFQKLYPPG